MRSLLRGAIVMLTALSTVIAGGLVSGAAAAYSAQATEGWAPNGGVNAIARHGDTIYLGGAFTRLIDTETGLGVRRAHAAAVDAATGEILPWNPGTDGIVRSIGVAPDGTVYLGGEFLSVAGQPAERLAAVRPDGTPVPGWSAAANDTVYDIVATGSGVIVAGPFGRVNGVLRGGIARVDPATGALDGNFNARVTGGRVRALALAPDGRAVLLGGSFSALSGASRDFVGAVDIDTGAPTPWAPAALCDNCHILDLEQGGGHVYGATAGTGGRAVAWSLSSGARAWLHRGDGDVQAIDYEEGVVYAGGHFGPVFSGAPRHMLAAIAAETGDLLPYQLPFAGPDKPGLWAVLADDSALRVGGFFRLTGSEQARYGSFPAVDDPLPASSPTLVAAAVLEESVRVSWSRPASDGGAPIERYEVSALPEQGPVMSQVCTTASLDCLISIGTGPLSENDTYRFTVRAITAAGAGADSAPSNGVSTDLTGPAVKLDGPRWRAAVGTSVGFAWSGSDPSGVDHYRVQRQVTAAAQEAGPWLSATEASTSLTVQLAPGQTVCLKVSGIDATGNEGPATRSKCRTTPVDDRSAVTKGKAYDAAGPRFYGNTATRLKGKSSLLRWRDVRASATRLVASSCPRCGSARVFYGKKLVKTIPLKSPTAQHQRVYRLPRAASTKKITIRPGSQRKILVDGVVLRPR